jgi:tetratricopeptide (TPR) repeat protein
MAACHAVAPFLAEKIEMKTPVANLLSAACAALLCLSGPAKAIIVVWGNTDAHDCFMIARAGNNPAGAIAACDSALEKGLLSPHDRAATFINRGAMKVTLNQLDDAITDFNSGIAIQPDLADAYVDRAIAFITQKRFDEALADINRCIALGPTRPAAGYYNRGVVEELSGKYQDAYLDYQKALQIEPTFDLATERVNDLEITGEAANVTPPGN